MYYLDSNIMNGAIMNKMTNYKILNMSDHLKKHIHKYSLTKWIMS